jgi:PhnB protein
MGVDRISTWVISRDTAAEISFLAAVFGAEEVPGSRVMDGDAIRHAEVALAGAGVLLFDAAADWPPTPAHLRIYVDDLDATVRAALAAGAVVVTEPTTMPFGDVVARLRDPQGHRWWVHHHVEDVPPEEMWRRFADPATGAAMSYLADSLDAEMTRGQ